MARAREQHAGQDAGVKSVYVLSKEVFALSSPPGGETPASAASGVYFAAHAVVFFSIQRSLLTVVVFPLIPRLLDPRQAEVVHHFRDGSPGAGDSVLPDNNLQIIIYAPNSIV